MQYKIDNMLLLDTNVLSREDFEQIRDLTKGPLFVSSVSAQELLGMQRPGKEKGYCYALPSVTAPIFHGVLPTNDPSINRWLEERARKIPVSKHADRQTLSRSDLAPESLELGHSSVSIAHMYGFDGLFRIYATAGLRGKKLRRVLDKWKLLRTDVESIIPLDGEISGIASDLANKFVAEGNRVKGTVRNTKNDLLVAATSRVTGIPLVSKDVQLMEFYDRNNWIVKSTNGLAVASPQKGESEARMEKGGRSESRNYINRPRTLRASIDFGRPISFQ